MSYLRWTLVLAALTVSIPALAAAPEATPKGVLEHYLQLDADATALSPQTWPEIGRYTTFPSAPSWDNFVVIDHYDVGRVMQGSTRAQASVTYHPLGQLSDKFVEDTRPETVVYHLNKVHGEWKVDGPPVPPHVSFAVMKKRLSQAADPKVKASNDALIGQIEAARAKVR